MMKTKKNILLGLSILALTLSATAIAKVDTNEVSAATTVQTVDAINDTLTDKDYYFKGYSLKWDDNTEYLNETSGDTAFHFKMYITDAMHSYLTSNANATTGTLIYPAHYLENGAVANLTKVSAVGEATPIDVNTTAAWSPIQKEQDKVANGTTYAYESIVYLKKIPREFYNAPIAVRGYVSNGNETYYTDATNETARSLSYITDIEYKDATSNFDATEKAAFRDALLQFKFKLDEGEIGSKYYGDPVEENPEEFVGYATRFTNQDETAVWDKSYTIQGDTWLKTQKIDAQRYYSSVKKAATFEVADIAAGVTQATVNGQSVTVTTEEGKVTLPEITGLTVGKSYLATVGDVTFGFTYVTDVKDHVPYAYNKQLWFEGLGDFSEDATNISSITDLVGADRLNGNGVVTDIDRNTTKAAKDGPSLLVTASVAEETVVYKIDSKIYDVVLCNDAQARAFFFGEETGSIYASGCATTVALATDVNPGAAPAKVGSTAFSGLFDGLGNKVTWNYTVTTKEASYFGGLFGHFMSGTVQNVALEPTYTTIYGSYHSIFGTYCYGAAMNINNAFIKVTVNNASETASLAATGARIYLGRSSNNATNLKDVVCVYTMGKSDYPLSQYALFIERAAMDTDGITTTYKDYVTLVEGQTNQYVYSPSKVGTMKNVNVIVPTGVTPNLGLAGNKCYAIGENQTYTDTFNIKYQGVNCYSYGDTSIQKKVGSWEIDLGSAVGDISATYVENK